MFPSAPNLLFYLRHFWGYLRVICPSSMWLREDFVWLLMNAQTALNASRLRAQLICSVSRSTYEVVWFFVMMLPISVWLNKVIITGFCISNATLLLSRNNEINPVNN